VCAAGAHYGQGYLLARPDFPPPPMTWPGHEPEHAVRKAPRPTLRRTKSE